MICCLEKQSKLDIKMVPSISPDHNYWQFNFVYRLPVLQVASHFDYLGALFTYNTLHMGSVYFSWYIDSFLVLWYVIFSPLQMAGFLLPYRLLFLIKVGRFLNWSWKHLAPPCSSVLSLLGVFSLAFTLTVRKRAKRLLN